MIVCTGWTWEYVEESLDLPRLSALTAYWNECPPMHVLVAGFLGYKPRKQQSQQEQLAALLGAVRPE